jgi:hypothetical protein
MTQPLFGAALSSRLPEEDFTHFTWLAFFALFVENLELILALDTAHRAAGQYYPAEFARRRRRPAR